MYTPVSTLLDIKAFLESKLKEENYTLQAAPVDGTYDRREDTRIIPPVRIAARRRCFWRSRFSSRPTSFSRRSRF